MKTIRIKENKPMTGSVNWLKEKLETIEFRFSNLDGIPAIVFGFHQKKKETEEILPPEEWTYCAVMQKNETDEIEMFMQDYEGTYILWPSGRNTGYEQWSMFPYLTPAAEIQCQRLLENLAGKLMQKVENDYGGLKIIVTVE